MLIKLGGRLPFNRVKAARFFLPKNPSVNESTRNQVHIAQRQERQILQDQFMNKYSHSFSKPWTHGLQRSFLSALIAQSLFSAVAQASSGGPPPNVDVS